MPSTAIQRVSYDDQTNTLFVTFIDGDTYAYFDVPARAYESFRRARSKGGFFARQVRGRYRYEKLEVGDFPAPPFTGELSA